MMENIQKDEKGGFEDVIFSLIGIWKNRDIDHATIRSRAWPERSLLKEESQE
jgi:hypothetical protein